jgi:LPXTG-motif cell wall-anchored protein
MSSRISVVLFAVIALLTFTATSASPAFGAASPQSPATIRVQTGTGWTPTGVTVKTGDTITIDAAGDTHLGPAPIDHTSPDGQPRSTCAAIIANPNSPPFAAPTLPCWSLIGRVGTNAPFPVGRHTSFTATNDGELMLGVNDNRLEDNNGTWSATIAVNGAAGAAGGGSSSNTIVFVIVGLAVLLLLAGLLVLARRRRKDERVPLAPVAVAPVAVASAAPPTEDAVRDDDTAFPEAIPEAVVIDELVDQPAERSAGLFAKVPGPIGTSVAPTEGEVADTNIFEVEIKNGTDLRIGYNYFPEDTNLHWQVRQGSLFAHGQFPTNGGGNMYHYVTLPLGIRLEPAPAAVDVQFTWAIAGVPFKYSVRRDPGI